MKQTIHEVNELPEQTFIGLFQDIYEHSSWIVKKLLHSGRLVLSKNFITKQSELLMKLLIKEN